MAMCWDSWIFLVDQHNLVLQVQIHQNKWNIVNTKSSATVSSFYLVLSSSHFPHHYLLYHHLHHYRIVIIFLILIIIIIIKVPAPADTSHLSRQDAQWIKLASDASSSSALTISCWYGAAGSCIWAWRVNEPLTVRKHVIEPPTNNNYPNSVPSCYWCISAHPHWILLQWG